MSECIYRLRTRQYVAVCESYYAPAPNRRGHKAMMLSDVCLSAYLSVAYIGPKSRTERPKNTKVGTEVAHVTRDSDTTFKVKGQLFFMFLTNYIRSPGRFAHHRVGRGKLLLRCRLLGGARRFGAHGGSRGAGAYRGGRPPAYSLYKLPKL